MASEVCFNTKKKVVKPVVPDVLLSPTALWRWEVSPCVVSLRVLASAQGYSHVNHILDLITTHLVYPLLHYKYLHVLFWALFAMDERV